MDMEILNKILTLFLPNFRRISIAQEFQMRSCYCLILIVFAISGSSLFSNGLIHCDGNSDVSENVKNNICWSEKVIYKNNFTKINMQEYESRSSFKPSDHSRTSYSRKRHQDLNNQFEKIEAIWDKSTIPVYRTCQLIFNTCFKLAVIYGMPYFVFILLGGDDLYGIIKGEILYTFTPFHYAALLQHDEVVLICFF